MPYFKNIKKILIVSFFAFLLFKIPIPDSIAQQSRISPFNLSTDLSEQNSYEKMLVKVQEKGGVRVILSLKTAVSVNEMERKQKITEAQNSMLQKIGRATDNSVKKFESLPYLAFKVNQNELEQLHSFPEVVSIWEDVPVPPTLDSSIPVIDADLAWADGYTGAGWTVAILDTGVDKTHEFLAGKVVSEACYSTTDAGYSCTSVCPGGVAFSTDPGSGVNCDVGVEGCTHGTHVAGIAAGTGDSYSGVAKDADIIAVQVFSRFDSEDYCGVGYSPCALSWTSDQILGLERVNTLSVSYDIASVNMSLGSGSYDAYCDDDPTKNIIDTLRTNGIATAIAAGNDYYWGAIGAPACISSAIAVGASTDADDFAMYSNIAEIVDMVAPGSSITSSTPGDTYDTWNGTSMATPHVTGAFAVMKSKDPTATVTEIETALENTGQTITETWFDVPISLPRIDLDNALNAFVTNCNPPDSGNWTVSSSCIVSAGDSVVPANMTVQNGVTVTIPNGVTLNMNLAVYNLVVQNGGKILVEDGGKIS